MTETEVCYYYSPSQSQLFSILIPKLSQTLLSFTFVLPFTLSFLLLAKASIITKLHPHNHNNSFFSWISICNRLLIILANANIIGSLAVIMSAVEGCSGFASVLKACMVIKGRTSTALSLALPMNIALATIDALFRYRIIDGAMRESPSWSLVFEASLLAYLYAMVLVLDTVVGYVLLKSCRGDYQFPQRMQSLREVKIGIL